MTVRVLGMRDQAPDGAFVVDTTTRATGWSRALSPMVLGPIQGPSGVAQNVENYWQFSKVYPEHWLPQGSGPTADWFQWRMKGFAAIRAQRYPMGKGAVPVCSWHGGRSMGYIEARKEIYVPAYRTACEDTWAFAQLLYFHSTRGEIWLRDFDGYDHVALGMSLDDVLNCEERKMGHAFVLAMMVAHSA